MITSRVRLHARTREPPIYRGLSGKGVLVRWTPGHAVRELLEMHPERGSREKSERRLPAVRVTEEADLKMGRCGALDRYGAQWFKTNN